MSRETIVTCNQCGRQISFETFSPPAGIIQLEGVRWISEAMDFCCWTCLYEWVINHNENPLHHSHKSSEP